VQTAAGAVYQFGQFEVNVASGELFKNGQRVKLQEQPLRLLVVLLENPGQLITRDELRTRIWPEDTFVDFDGSLRVAVRKLRDALDDDAESPRYVETIPKHGYRIIVPVTQISSRNWQNVGTKSFVLGTDKVWGQRLRLLITVTSVLLLAGIGGFWGYHHAHHPPSRISSLAVLPLENLSRDPDQEYFADGMTDELITNLAQIHSLRVISRTSVMQFKHTNKTLREIATALHVDGVIEGSVSRDGNKVQITAQLLDAHQERHLWAASYQRELTDVLSLQSQVAKAIADQVKAKLTPAEDARLARPSRTNPEAYDALLQGRFLRNRRAPAAMQKALVYFQKAVALDPGSADAWAALGDCYASLGGDQGTADPNSVRTQARTALEKALALDPDLAEAHSSMGWFKMWFDWDSAGAEREFLRGIELSPNDSSAHRYYAFYLRIRGRFDEALDQNSRAMDLSPLDILPQAHLMMIYGARNELDKAMEQANRVLEIDPDFTGVYMGIFGVYEARHQWPEAFAALEHIKDTYRIPYLRGTADVAAASGDMGRAGQAMADLKEYARHNYVSPLAFASFESQFGNRDKAFRLLEEAYRQRATDMIFLDVKGPSAFDQSDPRFQDMVRRVGFR